MFVVRVVDRSLVREDGAMNDAIKSFLAAPRFAVVGASADREKYGNKVLRCYMQHQRSVTPINPKLPDVEGLAAQTSLTALGRNDVAVSVITPPPITLKVVEEAAALGIKNIWMQPGAESPEAVAAAKRHGMNVIAGGPCVLVVLGFKDT